MRCIELAAPGGVEALRLVERPDPQPGPGQVCVRNAAAGVNYIDLYHRSGFYPLDLPAVLGLEGAGTVEAVGPGVADIVPGTRVAYTNVMGAYAERTLVPVERLVRVPDRVPLQTAAAAMLQGLTAHALSHGVFPIQAGDAVLVHAAAGGVGRLLVQFARARNGVVIATTSSDAKAALARSAGAAHVIRYDQDDFAIRTRELTGGAGVRAVYDAVGRSTFAGSLAALGRRGMLVLYGQASGPVPAIDPLELLRRGSLYLTRPSLFDYIATREELEARAAALFEALQEGRVEIRIEQRLPLGEAGSAHALLASRATAGKLLLIP
jgi:NADPH:quinone reductase